MRVNVSGPGGSAGIDPQALKILAEPLIEGASPQPARVRDSVPAPAPATDQVSVSLPELASAPLHQLIQTVEARVFLTATPPTATPPTATPPTAAPHHDVTAAYSRAAQALAGDVDNITLNQAKDSALKSVAKAAHSVESGALQALRVPENLDPQTVLALATQMIATQQYPNYLRAAELGNQIASWYDGPLTVGQSFRAEPRSAGGGEIQLSFRWLQRLQKLWRRAPLLVLLAAWLAAGLVMAPSPYFKIWGMGFLALIVLQFVLTIRGALRRKQRPHW